MIEGSSQVPHITPATRVLLAVTTWINLAGQLATLPESRLRECGSHLELPGHRPPSFHRHPVEAVHVMGVGDGAQRDHRPAAVSNTVQPRKPRFPGGRGVSLLA
jgi:hypothetical protein